MIESASALLSASDEMAVVSTPSARARALVSVDTASTRASVSVLILALTLPASVAGSSIRSMRLFSAVASSVVVMLLANTPSVYVVSEPVVADVPTSALYGPGVSLVLTNRTQ